MTILTFSVSAVKCFAAVGVSGFRLSTELRVASGNPEDRHELGCVILIPAWKINLLLMHMESYCTIPLKVKWERTL